MTNNQKIKRVYQCDLESEFENIIVPRGQQTRFDLGGPLSFLNIGS